MKIPTNIPTPYVVFSAVGTLFGGTILLKDRFGDNISKTPDKIPGKTVIVTGANTGIGKETAFEMARREARVILACRDMDKCDQARQQIEEETYNKNVICKKLDLASQISIRQFADSINKEERRLDVLINNAGVMACPKAITEEGIEYQLGVNHMGHFLLTNLLLDKLKEVADGRIINLTCPYYKKAIIDFDNLNSVKTYNKKQAYGQSKLANVLFTKELNRRLKGTNVTVNCVNPGVTNTEIGRHLSMSKSAISGKMMSPLVWLLLKTPKQGAQTSIYCAVSPEMKKVSGRYFRRSKEEEIVNEGLNEATAKRLWAVSEKWTKLA